MAGFGDLKQYSGALGIQPGHVWLCCAPLVIRCLDYGLTLYAQPAAYWAGDYQKANEGSHVLRWALQIHPAAFVAMAGAITALFLLLILCWPQTPARLLAAVLVFGHAFGVASWVMSAAALGPAICVVLLHFSWSLIDATWRRQARVASLGVPC